MIRDNQPGLQKAVLFLNHFIKIKSTSKATAMKKFFIFLLPVLLFNNVKACDICGCGVGNFNPYMFPHLVQKFVSVGYNYRAYETNAHDDLGNPMFNKEYYTTISLAAQFTFGKKIQLIGYLPFQVNEQKGPEGNKSLKGTGDAVLMINYKVFDHISDKAPLRQTIVAGGGVKLPTGHYQYEEGSEKEVDNANFQAGTGSTDFLINSLYALRYKQFAMSAGVTYKVNTSNAQNYRFGNRLLTVVQFKYVKDAGAVSLIPNTGLIFEKMGKDSEDGLVNNHTGGYNAQAIVGLDVNNKKIATGIFYSKPIKQNLAQGSIHAMPAINVHVSFIL
jgi:hypothetical protein